MSVTALATEQEKNLTASLFREDLLLSNAEEWLLQLDYAASKNSSIQEKMETQRELVKGILVEILPDIEDIQFDIVERNRPRTRVLFKTPYGWVPLQGLSLGYKTMMAWMVDLAARLFERYPDSPNPIAEPAVVLVDEIDLHMHPRWQRELIGFLSERFVNTQFIVTAHSPLVVQAASNANLALLRRNGDHVVIENDVQAIHGWRVDQILTSDIFGLESARSPQMEKLLKRRTEILSRAKLTEEDKKELQQINEQMGHLPTAETSADIEAMEIIRSAAAKLKQNKARPSDGPHS